MKNDCTGYMCSNNSNYVNLVNSFFLNFKFVDVEIVTFGTLTVRQKGQPVALIFGLT